jgi:hypothetical protein
MRLTDFLHQSFTDVTKRIDGKLLTLAGFATVMILSIPVGLATGRWIPDYIWISTLGFLAAGFGIDGYVTAKKIEAEAPPKPATKLEVDNAETINLPATP